MQPSGPEINRYIEHMPPTPLVLVRLADDAPAIWCKLEFMNPSGSTKDRIARFILGKALRQGTVRRGDWVVEASSGSTSIAMALAASQLGLRFAAVMPEGVSTERTMIIRSYGGEVILTPRSEGILGSIRRSEEEAERRGGFLPRQFSNPDNAQAHRNQTAQEIMSQLPGGTVDAVVSGVGTGGTLVGLYLGFSDFGCSPRPFAARPITGHSVQGGAGRTVPDLECCSFSAAIPGVVDGLSEIYKNAEMPELEEVEIEDSIALETTRDLIRTGFPVGPSSGLNFAVACQVAERLGPDALVVTVFPDRMERYFSTALFQEQGPLPVAACG